MIPKIIHFTWFSGDPYPEKIQICIDSWHKFMPEYEFVCWDAERIKEINSVWVTECLALKKWAQAADYVRLYAVYKYGGIYLDTDCLIYKSFNDLLSEHSFIGREASMHIEGRLIEMHLTSHCFGAEAGDYFVGRCLSYYEGRHFLTTEDSSLPHSLKYGITMMPYIQSEIAKQHGYCPYPSADVVQKLDCDVTIFPASYFDVVKVTPDSYCRHLAVGGWRESRLKEVQVTFLYKIQWRLEAVLRWVLDKMGYVIVKKI